MRLRSFLNVDTGFRGVVLSLVVALILGSIQSPRMALGAPAEPETVREALLAEGIRTLLRKYHLRKRSLDDATAEATFELFLSRLDPLKLYFTEADVNRLRQHALLLDDQLRNGQFTLAHNAGALRRKRVALVTEWVEALLAAPFDLTRMESLEINGKKRSFCRDDDALRERWRKVLKRQVLARMENLRKTADPTPGTTTTVQENGTRLKTDAEIEVEARKRLLKGYRGRLKRIAREDRNDDLERFINAFVQVYDPHTAYLTPFRKEDFDIRMSGSLEGIGAVLRQEDGFITVQRIVAGSASSRQGQLKTGDIILAVAQDVGEPVDVVDTRFRDVIRLIRGSKGTVVRLTVRKPDGQVVVIPITRDVVRIEAVYAKAAILKHEDIPGRFAYVGLPRFYGSTRGRRATTPSRYVSADLRRALEALADRQVRGLVLDMRGNSGGFLQEAVRASGLFIAQGPIVQVRSANDRLRVLRDRDNEIAFDGPMVILVNRFSASASEILAAALQDYERAVVVGSTTHGKGTVQHLHNLDVAMRSQNILAPTVPRLGVLKLTRDQFYRLNGDSTQLRGVIPDVSLPDPTAHSDTGEGSKQYAIPWDTVDPVRYVRWPHNWDVQRLRGRSLDRQAHNDAFIKVKARLAVLEKSRQNTVEVLDKTTWLQRRQREADEWDALKLNDHVRFTAQPVAYASPQQAELADGWRQDLQKDPWLEETLRVLDDMSRKDTAAP